MVASSYPRPRRPGLGNPEASCWLSVRSAAHADDYDPTAGATSGLHGNTTRDLSRDRRETFCHPVSVQAWVSDPWRSACADGSGSRAALGSGFSVHFLRDTRPTCGSTSDRMAPVWTGLSFAASAW